MRTFFAFRLEITCSFYLPHIANAVYKASSRLSTLFQHLNECWNYFAFSFTWKLSWSSFKIWLIRHEPPCPFTALSALWKCSTTSKAFFPGLSEVQTFPGGELHPISYSINITCLHLVACFLFHLKESKSTVLSERFSHACRKGAQLVPLILLSSRVLRKPSIL